MTWFVKFPFTLPAEANCGLGEATLANLGIGELFPIYFLDDEIVGVILPKSYEDNPDSDNPPIFIYFAFSF